jgi:outer membrane murein-binding lipoprotein Lpp
MGDSVEIGLREVYDAVREVNGKVDSIVSEAGILRYRVDQLEKDRDRDRAEREKEQASQKSNKPAWITAASGWAAAVGAYCVPFLTK